MKVAADNAEAAKLMALASEAIDRAKHSATSDAGHLLLDAINQLQTAYRALAESYTNDVCAQPGRCNGNQGAGRLDDRVFHH
jgi:hypothetical protein